MGLVEARPRFGRTRCESYGDVWDAAPTPAGSFSQRTRMSGTLKLRRPFLFEIWNEHLGKSVWAHSGSAEAVVDSEVLRACEGTARRLGISVPSNVKEPPLFKDLKPKLRTTSSAKAAVGRVHHLKHSAGMSRAASLPTHGLVCYILL